ncbi:MAG TPA: hypothetical protein PKA53_02560 [Sphingobacterium sp.]|nr:hypothetical protein [Sphingobacterium sp.]
MINTFSTYRRFIASSLAAWMSLIIISGVVFIHKEVTSTGEIVIHVHPYDFTDKSHKHHHHSDAEIQYLNVLFHGSYIETSITAFEVPIFQEFPYCFYIPYDYSTQSHNPDHYYLRGPPVLV